MSNDRDSGESRNKSNMTESSPVMEDASLHRKQPHEEDFAMGDTSRADDGTRPPGPTPVTTNRIDESIQELIRYVESKAAREPEDSIADYIPTERACRLLFSKLLVAQESHSFSKNAFADFLDTLSSAESYRLAIAQHAETALDVWNDYYKKEDPEQALSDKEASDLRAIVKSRHDWRIVYMKIVKKTIALDLYYLFISKPWSVADFMVRLLEYDPSMFEPTNGHEPCPRNFLGFLSTHEKGVLKQTCQGTLRFVRASHLWLQQNYPGDILDGLYSQAYQDIHPPPTNLKRLESLLHYYLKHIHTVYDTVITMFPQQKHQTL